MEGKPMSPEVLALTEKKMSMTLDDIINMSKTNDNKGRKQRVWNHNQKFSNNGSRDKNAKVERVMNNQSFMRRKYSNNGSQDKNAKVQRVMNNRSFMRQGALSHGRTNFQSNQFPLATEAAKKAAAAPINNRAFNQRRVMNVNKLRVAPLRSEEKAANGWGFIMKQNSQHQPKPATMRQKPSMLQQNSQHRAKPVPVRQHPQTLDALFANMTEQRSESFSQQNRGPRRNGGGRQSIVPCPRGRFIR
ncbi:hypothetical protein LIER_07939 [Lithospermum erythrorhizon]|uniref:Uncharacterized protein n=1 Tax=Lithospermum erythrorhizon TaxID=34254 RepID=A0AAV3PCT6_LITER